VSWREREARNEAQSRDQNEWIEATSDSFGTDPAMETFVCECGDADCACTVELSRAEYEAVRATSNRFVIALNHENPEMEVVISEGPRFAVVDKIHGWGLRIARATDPRSNANRQLKP
jgi:hypothetical protein